MNKVNRILLWEDFLSTSSGVARGEFRQRSMYSEEKIVEGWVAIRNAVFLLLIMHVE
jgi:hypothetical protein